MADGSPPRSPRSFRPSQRQRLDDGSSRTTSIASHGENCQQQHNEANPEASGSSSSSSISVTADPSSQGLSGDPSPPRPRQPSMSGSAWSSLQSQSPVPSPHRPQHPLSNAAPPLFPLFSGSRNAPNRPYLPLPRRSRTSSLQNSLPRPRLPTDIFSRNPSAPVPPPSGQPNFTHPAARRIVLPIPVQLLRPSSSLNVPSPGSTLAALLTDILGLNDHRAAQLEQYRRDLSRAHERPDAASGGQGQSSNGNAGRDNSGRDGVERSTDNQTASPSARIAPHGAAGIPAPPFSLVHGGTSIVVQGAMMSRSNENAEATGNAPSADAGRPESTQTASSAPSTEASDSNTQSSASQPEAAPSRPNVNAALEDQGQMLMRLLSIAAAATAASLMSTDESASGRAAQAPSRANGTPSGQPTGSSSSAGRSQPIGEPLTRSQSIRSSLSRTSNNVPARIREGLAGLASRVRFFSRSFMGGNNASSQASSAGNPAVPEASQQTSAAQPNADLQPSRSSTSREGLSLSDMIHEAIRNESLSFSGEDSEAPAASAPTSTPSSEGSDDVPMPQHLQSVLRSVRENRLHPGSEGSFERWLTDLGGDLQTAVRGMGSVSSPDANPTSVSEGSAPDTRTATSEQDDAATRAQSRRANDISDGNLSFFRLFRFRQSPESSTDSGSTDQAQQDARFAAASGSSQLPASSPPNGLVPCVVVGVRSHPGNATAAPTAAGPATTDVAADSAPDAGSRSTASEAANPASGQSEPQTQHQRPEATPSGAAATAGPARFLLFVSGGHYMHTHPLLTAPPSMAAGEFLTLIEVLANIHASAAAKSTQTVSKEDLAQSGLDVKTWSDIKAACVEADAEEGSTTKVPSQETDTEAAPTPAPTPASTSERVGTSDEKQVLALRSGDRCGICLEEWDDSDECRILTCRHVYHRGCVDEWLVSSSNTCPMCRTAAVKKDASSQASPSTAAPAAGPMGMDL